MATDIKKAAMEFADNMETAKAKEVEDDVEYTYTHHFSKPLEYDGEKIEELTFDWGKLTGRDAQAIEAELTRLGQPVVIQSISGPYLIRMAARACDQPIGVDAFDIMQIRDYNKIRNAARSFLLRSEL